MNSKEPVLSYNFSEKEVRELALLLRKVENIIPYSLKPFAGQIEEHLYNSMNIEELEEFFNRGKIC